LPGLADPQRAPAGYCTIPALVDGGRLGENELVSLATRRLLLRVTGIVARRLTIQRALT
jgi:hypothetical protein